MILRLQGLLLSERQLGFLKLDAFVVVAADAADVADDADAADVVVVLPLQPLRQQQNCERVKLLRLQFAGPHLLQQRGPLRSGVCLALLGPSDRIVMSQDHNSCKK